jgi:hypothetical protein
VGFLINLASVGIGALGLIAMAIAAMVAADFHHWASQLHAAAEARAARWPNWIRRDGWGRSLLAIRLYASALVFVGLLMVVAAFPRAGGVVGQYVAVAAFFGFTVTWVAAWARGFLYSWRLPHRRGFVGVWNFVVFVLEFTTILLSLAVSTVNSCSMRPC